VAVLLSARSGSWIGYSIGTAILSIGLIVALVRYFTFRYRIEEGALVIHQGLWGRLNRTVPISRIQNIDLSQNLFHRLLRVGEVRVETASGTEAEAIMRVLSIAEVTRLQSELAKQRAEIAERFDSANLDANQGSVTNTETAEEILPGVAVSIPINDANIRIHSSVPLLQLPAKLIVIAGLISNRGEVIAGILFGLFWQFRVGRNFFPQEDSVIGFSNNQKEQGIANALQQEGQNVQGIFESISQNYGFVSSVLFGFFCLIILFAILRIFSALWYLLKFYGYRLEIQGESLHLQCGLLTKISATIPLGRIQLVSIQRTWLMRLLDLASIRVETAGGSGKSEDAANTIGRRWFVPIIANQDVPKILSAIDSRIEFNDKAFSWQPLSSDASKRMIRPILFASILISIVLAFFQPYWGWCIGIPIALIGLLWVKKKSRSKRYCRTAWGILFRSGVLRQKCSLTFFDKIQSVQLKQSPFDRRWKMASLSVDTLCAGPADHLIDIEMLDSDFASRELVQLSEQIQSE
jgi:putative membrane protein